MKKKTLAVLASAVIAAVFATSVEAKTILRMATDVSRDNSQAVGAEHFARLVAEKTNGDVQIKFYPDGTLGSSQAIVSGTRTGNIDIAMIGTVNLGGLAEGFLALDLPFIFKDSAHVYRSLDGKAGAELFAELDKVGLTGLAFFENGFRNITNSRQPIKVPEDVKGLKIRVPQSQTLVKTFEALGANPVPMAYGELYTAGERAQFLSSLADNSLLIVAIALLQEISAPAWATPMLKFTFVVSYVLLAAFVAAFADSRPKGKVMFITNMIKITGLLLMLFGSHPLLAYGVVGLGAAAYSPAKYGILTELLPPEKPSTE